MENKPEDFGRDFYILMLVIHLCCLLAMVGFIATNVVYGPINGLTLFCALLAFLNTERAWKAASKIDWKKF